MLKIGLTGGIGSGKTAVADYFAALGVPVIDADVIARDLVNIHRPAYKDIVSHFGAQILQADKNIDRAKLRAIVFSDDTQRHALESILHPLVRLQIKEELSLIVANYCLIVIPLMIETNQIGMVDKVLVVDTPVSVQVQRTIKRDNIDATAVQAIIKIQADRQVRMQVADYVIENTHSLEALKRKVNNFHILFTELNNALVGSRNIKDNVRD